MIQVLEYLGYRVVSALAGLLPGSAVRRLGRMLGGFAYERATRRRRMAIRHMTRVLGSEHEVEAAAREAFRAYGRYWAEVLWVRPRRVPAILSAMTREGVEMVEAVQREGRGMIYVLPHVGNWEVAGAVANQLGLELIAVAEALSNYRVARWFARVRKAFGIDVAFADGGSELMDRLTAALHRGAAVALVTDRNVGTGGIDVEFFGETTALPAGAAVLALRADVPIFPVAAFFSDGGHHLVIEAPVAMPETGPISRRIEVATQRVAGALESLIRRDPTQWHILQPNWPSDLP